jgi:hypothetical protein
VSDHPSPRPLIRVAVVGDVGGHLDELRRELERLGADNTTARLPPDLTVVQLGDLVHRGPESEAVVALVDRYLTNQAGQWIQLVGNHEAHYLREPLFEWPQRIPAHTVEILHRWWVTGQMRAAVAITTPNEDFLVTHAGLTADFWRKTLGSPGTAVQAEAAINSLIGTRDSLLFRAGHMLTGRRKDRAAGPLWASPATELVPGWLETEMPFSQVHGHASIYDWQLGQIRAPADIAEVTTVDHDARHETVTLRGGRIIGIDPDHGRDATTSWRAWEIMTDVPPEFSS